MMQRIVFLVLLVLFFRSSLCATNCLTQTQVPQVECMALVQLYTSTNGPAWTDSPQNNWDVTQTPCSWTGVFCQGGKVIQITRSNKGLVGPFPDLSALTSLRTLIFTGNQLTGSIQSVTTLTTLINLRIGNNQLSGTIPDLSGLSMLFALQLGSNSFTGTFPILPASIISIDLNNNLLTGTIPELSSGGIILFDIHDNLFTGPLPASLENNPLNGGCIVANNPGLDACSAALTAKCVCGILPTPTPSVSGSIMSPSSSPSLGQTASPSTTLPPFSPTPINTDEELSASDSSSNIIQPPQSEDTTGNSPTLQESEVPIESTDLPISSAIVVETTENIPQSQEGSVGASNVIGSSLLPQQSLPEGSSQVASQGVSQGISQGVSQGASQGASNIIASSQQQQTIGSNPQESAPGASNTEQENPSANPSAIHETVSAGASSGQGASTSKSIGVTERDEVTTSFRIPSPKKSKSASKSDRTNCVSTCGNGIVECGEKCDFVGSATERKAQCCNLKCRFKRSGGSCEANKRKCAVRSRCDAKGRCIAGRYLNAGVWCNGRRGRCDGFGRCIMPE